MTTPLRRRPRRFPRVAAGRRIGLIAVLVVAGLGRAAAGAGAGLCIGAALGATPPSPSRILPSTAILVVSAFGLRLVEAGFSERLGQSFISQVRLRLLDAAQPLSTTSRSGDGTHLGRLVSDLNALRNWVSLGYAQMLCGSVTLATLLGILALTDPVTFWIASGSVAGVALTSIGVTPLLRGQIRILRRIRGRLTQGVVKAVLVPADLSASRAIPRLQRLLTPVAVRQAVLTGGLRRSAELMHGLFLLLVAFLVTSGKSETHPTFHPVTTLLFLGLMATALRELVHAWSHRLAFIESRRRIVRLLRTAREAASEVPSPAEESVEAIASSTTARA